MLPTADVPPQGQGWAFEFKWDGMRAFILASGEGVRVISRAGNDTTSAFPELGVLAETVGGRRVVLDGEVVACDVRGRPDFGRLQTRISRTQPSPLLVRQVPAVLLVFDLLMVDEVELLTVPYVERRERLAALGLGGVGTVRMPEHYLDVTAEQLLAVAREHDLEGIVAKRVQSRYRPGQRSREWIKTAIRHTTNAVVGGWVTGSGAHRHVLGALLLGVYGVDGRLHYAGHVGTGFSDRDRAVFAEGLAELARPTSPFADPVPRELARYAQWVEPLIVAEVEYRQWTDDGRLRHPAFRQLHPEVTPASVRRP
ncbi:bifunctional non-homologous end joining protein LigD [Saccharopolyspora erythraea NRRL 2338]|uniref:DNA ligase (ATP) n=1 Tax=Saccharopolyspora erythraea TaxID=1836 RepID=A0ABP3NIN5_SACER|nr:non-homologous end-joining DNA ligase [Saccharopolyspora erythraea]EQD86261.1 ATP-dependent DNA ligase [Saccharopolyspora erythraea D]PFG95734.1 bifunctional non-homologous end joining protein LigD [Saccharopolyspora erythraea NRRL 2338]QRK92330.1 non-homologous end-joining DNA ligase [Saccharopolyspora erythraea]